MADRCPASPHAGERIIDQAKRILKDVANLEQIARSGRDGLADALRLRAIYTIGPYLLPRLIPSLHEGVAGGSDTHHTSSVIGK